MSEISAYHEAGHAFIAIYVGARVRSVTIEPDRDDGPERHADIQVEWPLHRFHGRERHEKAALVAKSRSGWAWVSESRIRLPRRWCPARIPRPEQG